MGELTFGIILLITVSGTRAQTLGNTGPGLEVIAKSTVTAATTPAPPTNTDNTASAQLNNRAAATQSIINSVIQTKRQNALQSAQRVNGHTTDPSSQEPFRKYGANSVRGSRYQAGSTRSQLLPRSRLAMRNTFYRKFQAFLMANLAARSNASSKSLENRLRDEKSQLNEQAPSHTNSGSPTFSEKNNYNQNETYTTINAGSSRVKSNSPGSYDGLSRSRTRKGILLGRGPSLSNPIDLQDTATRNYASSLSIKQSPDLSSDQTPSSVISTQTPLHTPSFNRPQADLVSIQKSSKITSIHTNNNGPLKTEQIYPTEKSIVNIPKFELMQNVSHSAAVPSLNGKIPSAVSRTGAEVSQGQLSGHDYTRRTLVEEPYYDRTSNMEGSAETINILEKEQSKTPLVLSGAVAGLSQATVLSSVLSPSSSSSATGASAAELSTPSLPSSLPSSPSSPTFKSDWKLPSKDSPAYKLLSHIIKPSMLGAASIKHLQTKAMQKTNTHLGNDQRAAIMSAQEKTDTAAYHVAPVTYKATVGDTKLENVLTSQQSPQMYQFLLTVNVPSDVRKFSLNSLPNMIFDTAGNKMTHEENIKVNPASDVFGEATSTEWGRFEGTIEQKGAGQIRKVTNLNSSNFIDQSQKNIARQHSQKRSQSKNSYESNTVGIANKNDFGYTGGHPQSSVTLSTTGDFTGYEPVRATPKVFGSPVGGSYQLKTDIGGLLSTGMNQHKPNVPQLSGRLASELSGVNKKNIEVTQSSNRIYQPNTNTIQLSGGVTLQNAILSQELGSLSPRNSQISHQSRGVSQSSSRSSKQLEGLTQSNSNTFLEQGQPKNEYKSDILSKKSTNRKKISQGFEHQKAPKADTTLIQETRMLLNNVIKPQYTDQKLSLVSDLTHNAVSRNKIPRQTSPTDYVTEINQSLTSTSYTNDNNMNKKGNAKESIAPNNPHTITEYVPVATVDNSTPNDASLDAFFSDLAQYVGESSKRLQYLVFLKQLVDAELNTLGGQSAVSETGLIGDTSQFDSMAAVPSSTVSVAPTATSGISSLANRESRTQSSSAGLDITINAGASSASVPHSSQMNQAALVQNSKPSLSDSTVNVQVSGQTLTEGTSSKSYVNKEIGSTDTVLINNAGPYVKPDSQQSKLQTSSSFTTDISQERTGHAHNERVLDQQLGNNPMMLTTDVLMTNNPGAHAMRDTYQPLQELNGFVPGDITQSRASQETGQTLNEGALGQSKVINQVVFSAVEPMVGNAGSYAAFDSYQPHSTGPVVGDINQSAAYMAADIAQPVGPIATDITQVVGSFAADITQPVGSTATDFLQLDGPIAKDITQPVGPNAADLTQSGGSIIADITQPVSPIATGKIQSDGSIAADITQPVEPIVADITQSGDPIVADITQPVDPIVADITYSSEYITADVKQPVGPKPADISQMRTSQQTGQSQNARVAGQSFGNNPIGLSTDAIHISNTGSSAILDSHQPSFELVGPVATDKTHIGASHAPGQTFRQGTLDQGYVNDQMASSADVNLIDSTGSNLALNSHQYSSQSISPVSADVPQVRATKEAGQLINEGTLGQSYVNNHGGSASDAVMSNSAGTNTVIDSYQTAAHLNDPFLADISQVRAVQETGKTMNEGFLGKKYQNNNRGSVSDAVVINSARTDGVIDSYQTPAQLNGPITADITRVSSSQQTGKTSNGGSNYANNQMGMAADAFMISSEGTNAVIGSLQTPAHLNGPVPSDISQVGRSQQTSQTYNEGTLGTNYANNQMEMASDAVLTNSAGTITGIDSHQTPAQLNIPITADITQDRSYQQTGQTYNDATIGQSSRANQMTSTADAFMIDNAGSNAALNSHQLSSQTNDPVTAYITQREPSNSMSMNAYDASSIHSQKLIEIERSLSMRFPARAAESPGGICRLLHVCGRDGFTYISECLLPPSIGKACEGKCPCPVVTPVPPSNVDMTGVNNVLQDFITYLKGTMAVAGSVDGTAVQHPPPNVPKTFGYQKFATGNQPAHVSVAAATPGYQTSQIISLTLNQSSKIDVNTNGNHQPKTGSTVGNSVNSNGNQMQKNLPGLNSNGYQMQNNMPALNMVTSNGNQALGSSMLAGNQTQVNAGMAGQQAAFLNICVNRCAQMHSPVCAASGVIYENECFLICGREQMLCQGLCPCEYEVLPPAERQKLVATYSNRATLAGMDPMEFAEVAWTEERCACAATDRNYVCTSLGATMTQCASQCSGQPIKCKGQCPCK